MVTASHRSSEGYGFDPRLGLRNHFLSTELEDRSSTSEGDTDIRNIDLVVENETEICELTSTSNISNQHGQGSIDINIKGDKAGNTEGVEDKGTEVIEVQRNSDEQHPKTDSEDEVENVDFDETILPEQSQEKDPHLSEENFSHGLPLKPQIVVDEISGAFDPATVVGLNLTLEEKGKLK